MNKQPKPVIKKYFTRVPSRAKIEKYHTNLGQVKNVFNGLSYHKWLGGLNYDTTKLVPAAEVWELNDDNEYVLILKIDKDTPFINLPWNK